MRLEAQYTVPVLHHPTRSSRPIFALFTPREGKPMQENTICRPLPHIAVIVMLLIHFHEKEGGVGASCRTKYVGLMWDGSPQQYPTPPVLRKFSPLSNPTLPPAWWMVVQTTLGCCAYRKMAHAVPRNIPNPRNNA